MTHATFADHYQMDEPASSGETISQKAVCLNVNAALLCKWLWIAAAVIIGLGIMREVVISMIGTETVLRDLRHFALDAERSLQSWYESLTMAAASMLLAVIALISYRVNPVNRIAWTLLAAIFFLMSIDAAVSFHEISVKPLRNAFNLSGIFYYSWVIIAAPLVLLLAVYLIPFLVRLPARTSLGMIAAGAIFVGGALGTELLCGYIATTIGLDSIQYKVTAASQEVLETIGMTLFVATLLSHIARSGSSVKLHTTRDVG